MKLKKLSLRTRIFIAMILLVLLASILVAYVAIFQYKGEREDYHKDRLESKEDNIKTHISRVLNGRQNTWEVTTENIPIIFKEELSNIADIHKLQINLYDLEGSLLITSKANLKPDQKDKCLDAEILNAILNFCLFNKLNETSEIVFFFLHGTSLNFCFTLPLYESFNSFCIDSYSVNSPCLL